MASSKSNKKTKIPEPNQDLISSLPTYLTDNILQRLPLSIAAKMNVLSRKWRRNWLSLKRLFFDRAFWEEHESGGSFDWQKLSKIISNILLHHNGPVHEFSLHVSDYPDQEFNLNLSQWLSFLSRAGIKTINLINSSKDQRDPSVPSYIFACSELVELNLSFYVLNTPPSDYMGFTHLRILKLISFEFNHGVFRSLITNCPRLTSLTLIYIIGHRHTNLVFDHVPILEDLTVKGPFASLAFRNVFHLKRVSLSLSSMGNASYIERLKTVNAIKILAIPPVKLQNLEFDGTLCKVVRTKLPTFNHLQKLCLRELDLDDSNVFCFTISMFRNCPYIKDLELSITPEKSILQHKFDYDNNYKLGHLVKAKITGITGSSVELKLIEYVLTISVVQEKLLFKCNNLHPSSELKVLQELLQLPRASAKAKIISLVQ